MKVPQTKIPSTGIRIFRASRRKPASGMTLLEMTVVILVLLGLIGILFFGAQAWKRGSDRSICIINIQSVQKGVRSYSNLYGYDPGGSAPGLQSQIIGLGRFVETTPSCPNFGNYIYGPVYGADTIPPIGELYLECLGKDSADHLPDDSSSW